MATIRQYFETDFPYTLRVGVCLDCNGEALESWLHYDINGLTAFLSCFVPGSRRPLCFFQSLLGQVSWGATQVSASGRVILPTARSLPSCEIRIENAKEVRISARFAGSPEWFSTRDMAATRRIFIYTETTLDHDEIAGLQSLAEGKSINLQIREERYRAAREAAETPMAFISHDSRNKDVARRIAVILQSMLCPVWYDEFSLRVGDPLRDSIEKGLRECKKCILVLSPDFLANEGWTKVEFNSIFTREILEGRRLVLPVWLGVKKKEIYDYSPSLLDVKGVSWDSEDPESVCKQLHRAIVE